MVEYGVQWYGTGKDSIMWRGGRGEGRGGERETEKESCARFLFMGRIYMFDAGLRPWPWLSCFRGGWPLCSSPTNLHPRPKEGKKKGAREGAQQAQQCDPPRLDRTVFACVWCAHSFPAFFFLFLCAIEQNKGDEDLASFALSLSFSRSALSLNISD